MVISIPESTIEYRCQLSIPFVFLLFGECTVENRCNGFLICFHYRVNILGTTRTTFNLEHPNATLHQFVDEAHGLQVFRTHQVFIVYLNLVARFRIGENITSPTNLNAFATIGRTVGIGQTHVTLTRNGHAKSTMTEHLDTYQFAFRSSYVLFLYLLVDISHLLQFQFSRQHHHIGKLRIKLQCLDVRDIELRT